MNGYRVVSPLMTMGNGPLISGTKFFINSVFKLFIRRVKGAERTNKSNELARDTQVPPPPPTLFVLFSRIFRRQLFGQNRHKNKFTFFEMNYTGLKCSPSFIFLPPPPCPVPLHVFILNLNSYMPVIHVCPRGRVISQHNPTNTNTSK